ncbi:hypothetical protein FF38_03000 [Lucilia cuprina]|uniref:Uncharacterized protein n=1 Tax=Lucilia cuprina TaxID=7375 RepID=A0A0L0BY02_LUCCU|nr:hypothetical protein FF38_03000 [Lucilia cuprina]
MVFMNGLGPDPLPAKEAEGPPVQVEPVDLSLRSPRDVLKVGQYYLEANVLLGYSNCNKTFTTFCNLLKFIFFIHFYTSFTITYLKNINFKNLYLFFSAILLLYQ